MAKGKRAPKLQADPTVGAGRGRASSGGVKHGSNAGGKSRSVGNNLRSGIHRDSKGRFK